MEDEIPLEKYEFKNVLITGGCGFIASNFVNYLLQHYPNANFVNIDCLYYCSSEKNIVIPECTNYKFVRGSITNFELVYDILVANNIDTILHFAAKTHVDESFAHPSRYVENNIIGTFTMLEACRKYGKIGRFFHMSTDEVYGDNIINDEVIMTEKSSLNPTNPYSATKAAAEILAATYKTSYNIPVIITRCNNVYGNGQYPEKLIPKFICILNKNEKCTIHGSGMQARVFIHVDDAIAAYEMILKKGVVGEKYNIGSKEKYSVLEVTKLLISKIKPEEREPERWIEFVEDRAYNDASYDISWDKLSKLGWKSSITLSEGLDKVIEWYKGIAVKDHWPLCCFIE